MRATFDGTVAILVKAYLNDTLRHGNCTACAVGNIIAACHGWDHVIKTEFGVEQLRWSSGIRYNWYTGLSESPVIETDQTIPTGYTASQLSSIEIAFEQTYLLAEDGEEIFESLMAVVDVLAEIHGINLSEKESAKALFVKA